MIGRAMHHKTLELELTSKTGRLSFRENGVAFTQSDNFVKRKATKKTGEQQM